MLLSISIAALNADRDGMKYRLNAKEAREEITCPSHVASNVLNDLFHFGLLFKKIKIPSST
jgi:hypothetical protein